MKIRVGFIVVLIIIALSVVNSSIPDLSWDNYVDDIVSISPFVQLINNIRYNNEDKPDHCRNGRHNYSILSRTMLKLLFLYFIFPAKHM